MPPELITIIAIVLPVVISAILSPIITNKLNLCHIQKMKDMELKEKRIQVFEKFLRDYGR